MPRLQKFCACGCGQLVRAGNRYVNHHAKKGGSPHQTEEANRKRSVALKGNKNGLGYKHTEEWKKQNSIRHKGNKHALGSKHTEEWKRQNSTRHKGKKYPGRVQTEESNRKRSATQKGKITSEETKIKMSAAAKGRDMSQQVKISADLRRGIKLTDNTKLKMSKAQKRLWADPSFHRKQQSKMARGSRLARPNKVECQLLGLLETLQPGDWKYVGDGSLVIAGKNPDFVNVNGKKLIIELFGDYWHRNDNPKERAAVFSPFGFRTLVVWEKELKNSSKLTNKIKKFAR